MNTCDTPQAVTPRSRLAQLLCADTEKRVWRSGDCDFTDDKPGQNVAIAHNQIFLFSGIHFSVSARSEPRFNEAAKGGCKVQGLISQSVDAIGLRLDFLRQFSTSPHERQAKAVSPWDFRVAHAQSATPLLLVSAFFAFFSRFLLTVGSAIDLRCCVREGSIYPPLPFPPYPCTIISSRTQSQHPSGKMSFLRSAAIVPAAVARRQFSSTPISRLASASSSAAPSSGPWSDPPSTPRLNRYLVIAEDFSDAGANARRFEVRERHLEQAQNGKRAGRIELGGALLRKDFPLIDQDVGPGPYMGGSVLVVLGESVEDVRERVMKDEYVQGNVWDTSKLKIWPFLQAPLKPAVQQEDAAGRKTEVEERGERAGANATLGQLRQDLAAGKGHKMVTLGALRRIHQGVGQYRHHYNSSNKSE